MNVSEVVDAFVAVVGNFDTVDVASVVVVVEVDVVDHNIVVDFDGYSEVDTEHLDEQQTEVELDSHHGLEEEGVVDNPDVEQLDIEAHGQIVDEVVEDLAYVVGREACSIHIAEQGIPVSLLRTVVIHLH